MQINGTITGKIIHWDNKADGTNDGSVTLMDIKVHCKREEAAAMFGPDFEDLAFASTRGGDESPFHLQDSIKPGKHIECFSTSSITMEGETIVARPTLRKITTVGGEASVVAVLRIEVPSDRKKLSGKLNSKVGKNIKLGFEPQQKELGFEAADGDTA